MRNCQAVTIIMVLTLISFFNTPAFVFSAKSSPLNSGKPIPSVSSRTPLAKPHTSKLPTTKRLNGQPKLGYCCQDGKISSSVTKNKCQKLRGTYFATEKETKIRCTGFCCDEGTVDKTTEASCKKQRGLFYGNKKAAENRCAKDRGFCCDRSKISPSTVNECKKVRGTFYSSKRKAAQNCQGFCCDEGTVDKTTEATCKKQRGLYYTKKNAAEKCC